MGARLALVGLAIWAMACATVGVPPRLESLPELPAISDDAPEQSLRAAPVWARSGFAPQSSLAWILFERAGKTAPRPGAQGGVLICHVNALVHLDTLGSNDLRVTVTVGAHPSLVVDGPDGSDRMLLTVPLVPLSPNGGLRFEIVDRDVLGLEEVGTMRGFTEGAVARIVDRRARIDCRWIDQRELAGEVARQLDAVDAELGGLPVPQPDAAEPDWGLTKRHSRAREQLREAAALAGWADARVAQRLSALRADEEKVFSAADAWSNQKAAASEAGRGTLIESTLTVRVVGVTCGPAAVRTFPREAMAERPAPGSRGPCVVGLEFVNRGDRVLLEPWHSQHPLALEQIGLPAFVVPRAVQGTPTVMRIDRTPGPGGWVESFGHELRRDERATFWVVGVWPDAAPDVRPTLLLFPVKTRLVAVTVPSP